MRPDSAPKPRVFNVASASIPNEAPTAIPRMSRTLIVPPSTMSAPLPQDISITVANVWREYRRTVSGKYQNV
jgi:hypothetical protein